MNLQPKKSFNSWISFEKPGGEGITGNMVCPCCSDCFLNDPDAVIVMDINPSDQCVVCDIEVREYEKKAQQLFDRLGL